MSQQPATTTTVIKNFASDKHFYISDNRIVRHLIRELGNPIGAQAFGVFCMFKSFCVGSSSQVFVNASQHDWAEYLGMTQGVFQRATKALETIGLLRINRPQGANKLKWHTLEYILLEPDVEKMFSLEDIESNPILKFDNSITRQKRMEIMGEPDTEPDTEIADAVAEVAAVVASEPVLATALVMERVLTSTASKTPEVPTKRPLKSRAKTKEALQNYMSRAERLHSIVESYTKVNKKASITDWANSIRLLHKRDNVPLKRIDLVMDWYAENIGDEYVPEAFSGGTFRSKFVNLEQAVSRATKVNTPAGNKQFQKVPMPVFKKPEVIIQQA